MAVPGFDDPALAAPLASGNLFFAQDLAAAQPGTRIYGYGSGGPTGQPIDGQPPKGLMFGSPENFTGEGKPIIHAATQSKGHVSEIFNFHGSPAPWILIGILVVAGILHLQAKAGATAGVRL